MIFAYTFKTPGNAIASICEAHTPGGARSYLVRMTPLDMLRISTYHGGGSAVFTSDVVTTDEWHDVVVGWDGSTRWVFIDGVEVEARSIPTAWDEAGGDEWLGCDYQNEFMFTGEVALPFLSVDAVPTRAQLQALAYSRLMYLGIG